MHLPEVSTESGIPTQVTRTFSFTHKSYVNCTRTDGFTLQLQSYQYDLYGQVSHITGGEDNDVYYIPTPGERASIAHDEVMDTLLL